MVKNPNSIILVSKDALGTFYLPIYGNLYWQGKTPNIDELASKGTVFKRHYTAAPSSAMSYFSMWTGVFAHETNRKDYLPIKEKEPYVSFFDKAYELGYDCHIIWDSKWMTTAKLFSECYGDHVTYNDLYEIRQPVGSHQQHKEPVKCNEENVDITINRIIDEIQRITSGDKKVFLWMHLPHVLYGRNTYGSDIDVYDRIIGKVREFFADDNIFVSSDHGNMNGTHGKIGYGFDVNESAIRIPLISPRIDGLTEVDFPTSTVDLFELIFERKIKKREVVYSDSAYYCQLNRKLAIIKGDFKYIYNRQGHKEELYDVVFDPAENVNLMSDNIYDSDRHLSCPMQELYFYTKWKMLPNVRKDMRELKNSIWREGSLYDKIHAWYLYLGKTIWRVLSAHLHKHGIDFTLHSTKK